VQDIVVGNKTLSDVNKPNDIVQLLLTDDQIGEDGGAYPSDKSLGKRPVASDGPADGWAQEDGDDFFGHSGPPAAAAGGDSVIEDTGEVVPVSGRGRGRGRGRGAGRGTGRGRGRGKAAGEPTSRGRGKRRGGAAAADT
jgi:DNA helicase INO80